MVKNMKLKKKKNNVSKARSAEKSEQAMIEGIMEGSPDGIGVAVVRLQCGCRKMAAVDKDGNPASEVIIYRDSATSICDLCKQDDGAPSRVREAFIHWVEPKPDSKRRARIEAMVLGGSYPAEDSDDQSTH